MDEESEIVLSSRPREDEAPIADESGSGTLMCSTKAAKNRRKK